MFGIKENRYDFRKRLLCGVIPQSLIQTTNMKDGASFLKGVNFKGKAGSAAEYAESHFCNFLKIAAGVENPLSESGVTVEFIKDDAALKEYASYKGRVISVNKEKIIVNAFDDRGAAAAVYDLEKMMYSSRAPFIGKGEYKNKPLFSPRMVHSAYGLEEYPEEYMVNLVKEGIDAIVIFVKDINTTQIGELDFNALIAKANAIGLDVYAYCMLNNFHHPDEPDAEKIFDGIYGRFFRAHPGFKGLVLVGESVEFPSKDERVAPRHYYELGKDNIPDGKVSPGWWPCRDYPEWLDLVAKSIRRVKPDADIVFWTYNWGYAPEKERLELIESLPENISLQVTFEMFEKYPAGKTEEMVCDYSIAFPGPGKYFTSEAQAAAKRGIKLYTMCNAGGRTWDFGVLPYIPAADLWKERYEKLAECHEKYGLSGLMECHHYGYTPSFLTRFAGYCFENTGAERDYEKNLFAALKEFYGENAATVRKALSKVSEAMRMFPPTDEMQYGPMRIATAYPLNLIKDLKPKETEKVSFGLSICNITFTPWDFGRYAPQCLRLESEIKVFGKIIAKIKAAVSVMETAGSRDDEFLRLLNMLKFMACSFTTAKNTLIFYKWKCRLFAADTKEKLKTAVAKIRETGEKEIKNAEESIEYVEKDSALGFEPSMGYVCDRERILWKIKQVGYMLDKELGNYDKEW